MDEQKFMELTARVMSDQTPLAININIRAAWLIVSSMQLAARHPNLSKPMVEALVDIARQFENAITDVHPEAELALAMGWNPEEDR